MNNSCSAELPLLSNCSNATFDAGDIVPEPNLWCLLLVLFPATCVFGNTLVVVAVLKERCLQTSTNYLLVSLAVADMLVALLVMPFSVYLTVNRLYWFLPMPICDFFCVVDVSASTASIVHLVAISIDRFYAVVKHMEYKTSRHKKRINCTILFCWMFSAVVGLPLGIGLNHGGASAEQDRCGIVNPNYMLYSSIFAFYIPCLVMVVMYSFVFYRLHKRMLSVRLQEMAAGKMVNFGDNLGNILQNVHSNKPGKNTMSWALPFLKSIEQALANMVDNDDVSLEELDELTTILQTLQMNTSGKSTKLGSRSPHDIPLDGLARKKSIAETLHFGRKLKLRPFRSKSITVFFAKTKIGTLKDRAIELLMRMKSRQGIVIRKEARATKLVATVMLIFLLCYMPFFTMNIVKVFKLMDNSWTENMEQTFIIFTWFGYVNSCLNPAIYSLFNRKFRIAFKKLLCCQNVCTKRKFSRKFATGTLIPTSYSPTNEQPTTYNFDVQVRRLANTVEKKFNRRLSVRATNFKTSVPLLPEKVSVHRTMNNSNSNDKIRDSVRNSKYSFENYKILNSEEKVVENDLHASNKSLTISTNNVSELFDDDYIDFANVKIKCFFTEAVEV